jgi:hypothetical protein
MCYQKSRSGFPAHVGVYPGAQCNWNIRAINKWCTPLPPHACLPTHFTALRQLNFIVKDLFAATRITSRICSSFFFTTDDYLYFPVVVKLWTKNWCARLVQTFCSMWVNLKIVFFSLHEYHIYTKHNKIKSFIYPADAQIYCSKRMLKFTWEVLLHVSVFYNHHQGATICALLKL